MTEEHEDESVELKSSPESYDEIPIFDEDKKHQTNLKISRRQKKVIWKTVTLFSLYFSLSIMHLQSILFPVVLPYLVTEKLITTPESGLVIGSSVTFYIFGSVVIGLLTDFVGPKIVLVISLTCLSTAIILFGFSWNTLTFLITWSFARFCSSSSGIVLTKIVSNWFPKKNYGVAFGFLSTSIEFGPTIALMGFGILQTSFDFNWRFIFWVSGGLIVIVQLFSVAPLKTKPKFVGLRTEDEKIEMENHPMDDKSFLNAIIYMFMSPRFYLIVLAQSFFNPVYNIPSNWLPLYFFEVTGFSKPDAATMTSLLTFGKCIGVFLGGLIFDLLSAKLKIIYILSLLVLTSISILVLSLWSNIPSYFAVLFLMIFAVCQASPYFLVASSFAASFGGRKYSGMVFGFIDSISFLADAGISFAAGYLIQNLGWSWFWMLLTILSTIATFFFGMFMIADWWVVAQQIPEKIDSKEK
eukprot:gene1136-10650_t